MFKETSVAALVKKFAPCASEPYAFCTIQHSRFSLSSLGCLRATPGRILLESGTIITAAAQGQETDADGVWEGWQLSPGVLTGKYYRFTLLCKRNQSPAASCQPERSSYHVPKVPGGLQDVFCSNVPGRRHLAASSFGPACSREAPGSSALLEQGSKAQAGC